MGQGVNALGRNLQQGEGRRGGMQFMIICKSSDATGPRNLKQSNRQALLWFEFKRGCQISTIWSSVVLVLGWQLSLARTRKSKDKPSRA